MKNFVLYKILLIALTFPCLSQQNLIFNGDFELYDTCPDNPSFPGDLQLEHCLGWTVPRKEGTSDYFNVCNNPINGGLAGVPSNLLGYQYPYDGDGYCGFFAWALNPDLTSYREYLQTELLIPLEKGKAYQLRFFVSYSGNSYSVEKIGALFSAESFEEVSARPIVRTPQVVNKNGILIDSLNWMLIEGQFIAAGNERFLTFGYFEDSLVVSDTLNTYSEEFPLEESYYYIDGVELTEMELELPNVFSPNSDGLNDFYEVDIWVDKFTVLNRWGNLVYESNNSIINWDGRNHSGNEVSEGVYFYVLQISDHKRTGFFQLIR